ncbi:MAG TPA: DUF6636 domain-containing protein [Mycobacteriales bacterium]|nr:DUF6636 domain-containing protein [Mycobacteriales bacterium]
MRDRLSHLLHEVDRVPTALPAPADVRRRGVRLRRRRQAAAGGGALAVLAVVAVGMAALSGGQERLDAPPAAPRDSTPPSASAGASPSPSADGAAPTAAPGGEELPAAAVTTVAPGSSVRFSSPSGNISCFLSGTGAVCEIAEHDYQPPPRPADCELDHGTMIELDQTGPARFACHGDTGFVRDDPESPLTAPGPVLAYGEQITNGIFTCTSRRSGMACATADGGHGFELARAGFRTY